MIRDENELDAGIGVSVSPSPEGPIEDIDTGGEEVPLVVASSPLPVNLPPIDLDFGQAMRRVVDGARVRRRSWAGLETVFLRAGVVHIQNDNGTHTLIMADADITATDWVVLEH